MNSNEPVELISHIKAIFHFLGGICIQAEDGADISILKYVYSQFHTNRGKKNEIK